MPKNNIYDIAIDLGTSNVIVSNDDGIVVNEPCFVATRQMQHGKHEIVGIGRDAALMLGKTPIGTIVRNPLSKGVISEFELASSLLRIFIKRAEKRSKPWRKPRVLLTLPSDVTPVEERAFYEAGMHAGARDVTLVPEPTAAALGLGIDIFKPKGAMVVDVGGGITEVALFSLGGLVYNHAVRVGGYDMDEAIVQYLRNFYNFEIGPRMAEQLKISASQPVHSRAEQLVVKGINLVNGLPASMFLRSAEVHEALDSSLRQIVKSVLHALECAPEELSADLIDAGIWLVGGSSLTGNLLEQLSEATGLKIHTSLSPLLSVAHGELRILQDSDLAKKVTWVH